MSIYTGFEGHRPLSSEAVQEALRQSIVVLDTNVLLELYAAPSAARDIAFDHLAHIGDRLWVPHQVLREFWRNRHLRIIEQSKAPLSLGSVRSQIFGIINRLRPDRQRTDDLELIKRSVEQQLNLLQEQVDQTLGEPLDTEAILRDPTIDPVVGRLEGLLQGKVGVGCTDEAALVTEGLKRFERKVPPGYMDGPKKKDQFPERGTGDYLIWEQCLRHLAGVSLSLPWIFVTSDEKEDWRIQLDQKRLKLGARPELVSESLSRVAQPVIILSSIEFYDQMLLVNPPATGDADDANESLIETISQREGGRDQEDAAAWTREAYYNLLTRLESRGYLAQLRAIKAAAASIDAYVDRASLFSLAGYAADRTLRRFSLPAARIMLELISEELLAEDAPQPLTPVYAGPGPALGYRVPSEFVDFEDRHAQPSNLTWIAAAVEVARTDSNRDWSLPELVEGIRRLGLKDLSNARTPEDTLGRDLRLRQEGIFLRTEDGRWRLGPGAALE